MTRPFLYLSEIRASVCFGLQIDRRIFAATIDLDIEIETVALIEVGHARALDGADMDECIRLTVIALDKAEALHCIEELDRSAGVLAGQLALRPAAITAIATAESACTRFARPIDHGEGLALDLEVGSRNLAATVDQREAEWLSFGKPGQASLLDGADMNEHVFGTIVANDETETLLSVEEFYDAGAFTDNLGRHAATTTAATAAAAKSAAAAAEAATVTESTAAAAKSVSAETAAILESAEPTTALIGETTKIVAANIVAFVSAASAATSIKTHARIVTFARPKQLRIDMSDEEHAESAA